MGVGDQRHTPSALPPLKDPLPNISETVLAPVSVWTSAESLKPHRDSITGPSSPAIRTELSRSRFHNNQVYSPKMLSR